MKPGSSHTRRVFVHIGGYYPLSPEDAQRRFRREHERFLKTWGLRGSFGHLEKTTEAADWPIRTEGGNWSSDVEHILFRWEDIIEADRDRGWVSRIGLSLLTFVDFVANGALTGYVRHAWRYAGFFLYPFVLMAMIFAGALYGLHWLMTATAMPGGWFLAVPAAVLVFFALLHAFGTGLKLDHLLDDWNYGRRIVRAGDPAVEVRLARLAERLNDETREVLIVGHSFGAIYGAVLIAEMVSARPEGAPIRFASVGASILKIGFNRAARPLRQALTTIAASPRVIWYDFTALNDLMNFHLVEPLRALGLPGKPAAVRKVRFRLMLEPAYYRRMQINFFRIHNQFISGNDRRAPYDYFMLMCGPWPLETLSDAPQGAIPFIDEQGELTEAGKSANQTADNTTGGAPITTTGTAP